MCHIRCLFFIIAIIFGIKNKPADSPRIVGPGNVFFEFMQPRIAEYTITSGCQTCGTENNVTNRQESQSPYFIQQLDQVPAGGNLAVTFAARFQGSMIVFDCINSENCVVFFATISEEGLLQEAAGYDRIFCPICQAQRTKRDFTEIVEASAALVISIPRIHWNRRNTVRIKNRTRLNQGGDLRLRMRDGSFVIYRLHVAVEHLGR